MLDFAKQDWYLFSSSVHNRKEVFFNADFRNLCRDSFLQTQKRANYLLASFILMPDHMHILAGDIKDRTLASKIIKDFKGASARMMFKEYSELKADFYSHHFWTDGYNARIVLNLIIFKKALKYIINNPIKDEFGKDDYCLYVNPIY